MRVIVDWDLCQGHGTCKAEAPEVFDVDEGECRVIVRQEQPPDDLRDKVTLAVKYCPTHALSIED